MNNPTESDVQRACLDLLALRGVFAWRCNNTGVYDPKQKRFRSFQGMKGVADILGVWHDGRFLAVEVKRPGGKLRPEQEVFLDAVSRLGGLAVCVDDVRKLEEFLNAVEEG